MLQEAYEPTYYVGAPRALSDHDGFFTPLGDAPEH